MIAACLVSIAVSCQKDEKDAIIPSPQTEIEAHDALMASLRELNIKTFGEDYAKRTFIENETRAKARWWKWLLVGVVDAGAALIPGSNIAGGIAASTLVWTMMRDSAKKEGANVPETSIRPYSTYDYPIYVMGNNGYWGRTHNWTIDNMYNYYGEDIFSNRQFDAIEQIEIILFRLNKWDNSQNWLLMSPYEIYNTIYPMIEAYANTEFIDLFCYQMQDLYPTRLQEFDVFKEMMYGFSILDIDNDRSSQYAKSLITQIMLSGYSADKKSRLVTCVSIANGSVRLWRQKELQSAHVGN